MVTKLASVLRTAELRTRVTSLESEHCRIINAINVLTGGG